MQNKGIVIVTAVLLTLASIFYLSFSVATSYYDSKASEIKDPIAQQDYKDSVKYLGIYTYQKCLETQIGLGLDLKGGMNVILEISVPDVIDVLADHKADAAYRKSMDEAKKEEETSQKDFLSLFIKAYQKNAPGHRLAEIFATQQLKGKVSTQSTDEEVEAALPEFRKASPVFGEGFAWASLNCAQWPTPATSGPHRIEANGAAPIVVVGTTRDPATPYRWARGLASQLDSATLLTYDGDGHTAFGRGSDCVDTAINTYLLEGTPPDDGTRC